MLAKVLAGAPLGIDAYPVEVEVDIAQGAAAVPPSAFRRGGQGKQGPPSSRPSRIPVTTSPPAASLSILPPADIRKDGTATTCRWPSAC